jgi:type I restriction enzyme, S subunit
MKLKQYPKYKDSGVQWIGDIPEDWEIQRFKIKFRTNKGKLLNNLTEENGDNLLPYLSMDYLRGNKKGVLFSNDVKGVKVKEDDLLLLWDGSNAGEFVKSKKGYLSSTMVKLNYEKLNKNYVFYLCYAFEPLLRDLTIGMGIPHVNGDILGNIKIPIIENHIQNKIISFLDKKTKNIGQTIEKDKKLIELLKEKRIALINLVVTKGLDKNVKMKDSGIDCIGEIPKEWSTKKIKHFSKIITGSTPRGELENWEGDIIWVTPADLSKKIKYITSSKRQITKKGYDSCGTTFIKKDSLIIASRAPIGYPRITKNKLCFNQGCKAFEIEIDFIVEYCYYYLLGYEKVLVSLGNETTFSELGTYNFASFRIPLPSKPEQLQIIQYLDKETSKIDQIIKKIEEKINLMGEYKKSLIHHVVTGKVDVRGVEA